MNQKLAKAKRKAQRNNASELDIERLKRNTLRRVALMNVGPKFPKPRKKDKFKPIKATWPKSDDQMLQGRPMIVEKPFRHLCQGMGAGQKGEFIAKHQHLPRHVLAEMVIGGTTV